MLSMYNLIETLDSIKLLNLLFLWRRATCRTTSQNGPSAWHPHIFLRIWITSIKLVMTSRFLFWNYLEKVKFINFQKFFSIIGPTVLPYDMTRICFFLSDSDQTLHFIFSLMLLLSFCYYYFTKFVLLNYL